MSSQLKKCSSKTAVETNEGRYHVIAIFLCSRFLFFFFVLFHQILFNTHTVEIKVKNLRWAVLQSNTLKGNRETLFNAIFLTWQHWTFTLTYKYSVNVTNNIENHRLYFLDIIIFCFYSIHTAFQCLKFELCTINIV